MLLLALVLAGSFLTSEGPIERKRIPTIAKAPIATGLLLVFTASMQVSFTVAGKRETASVPRVIVRPKTEVPLVVDRFWIISLSSNIPLTDHVYV